MHVYLILEFPSKISAVHERCKRIIMQEIVDCVKHRIKPVVCFHFEGRCLLVLDLLYCPLGLVTDFVCSTLGLVTDFVCSTLGLVTDSVCLQQGGFVTS